LWWCGVVSAKVAYNVLHSASEFTSARPWLLQSPESICAKQSPVKTLVVDKNGGGDGDGGGDGGDGGGDGDGDGGDGGGGGGGDGGGGDGGHGGGDGGGKMGVHVNRRSDAWMATTHPHGKRTTFPALPKASATGGSGPCMLPKYAWALSQSSRVTTGSASARHSASKSS